MRTVRYVWRTGTNSMPNHYSNRCSRCRIVFNTNVSDLLSVTTAKCTVLDNRYEVGVAIMRVTR